MKNFAIYVGILLAGILVFKINQGEITSTTVLMNMQKPATEKVSVKTPELSTISGDPRTTKTLDTHNDADPVTIMAFGDMMLGRYVRTLMDKNGKDYIFGNINMIEEPFYGGADVVFANLEGPIKGEGYKHQTAMVFGFHTDTAEFLKKYGFDVFSIANNHALDQKADGRDTTIKALEEQGLGWCGNVTSVDPDSVYYGGTEDSSYAFVCLNDVLYGLDKTKALELVKQVKEKVDYLIVSIHWGYEYKHTPNNYLQVNFAHALVDAGADFIIGHHPHVVQSFEKYNGKMIFYSLGNFVFDQYWSRDTQEELAIKITLDKEGDDELITEVKLFPMKSELSQPRLMNDDETAKWLKTFVSYGVYDEETKEEILEKSVGSSNF
ncbi:MAG: CapA family protein [Candidatus Gracilibacteria bacterium]|jgi:poly-gamma-glutamate synthesis protein (capsule biosynthesis protein)